MSLWFFASARRLALRFAPDVYSTLSLCVCFAERKVFVVLMTILPTPLRGF